jgi:hypothetical protein
MIFCGPSMAKRVCFFSPLFKDLGGGYLYANRQR